MKRYMLRPMTAIIPAGILLISYPIYGEESNERAYAEKTSCESNPRLEATYWSDTPRSPEEVEYRSQGIQIVLKDGDFLLLKNLASVREEDREFEELFIIPNSLPALKVIVCAGDITLNEMRLSDRLDQEIGLYNVEWSAKKVVRDDEIAGWRIPAVAVYQSMKRHCGFCFDDFWGKHHETY